MSELIRKAHEVRVELDAKDRVRDERKAQMTEQERIRAIQHEIDARQSAERVAEFLQLTSDQGTPPDRYYMPDPKDPSGETVNNSAYYYRGWVMKKPSGGGGDEPYCSGFILLSDGTTHSWTGTFDLEGQKIYGYSFSPDYVADDAYCGDAGLLMLGTKLAELGIVE